jgi:hypothetical protein
VIDATQGNPTSCPVLIPPPSTRRSDDTGRRTGDADIRPQPSTVPALRPAPAGAYDAAPVASRPQALCFCRGCPTLGGPHSPSAETDSRGLRRSSSRCALSATARTALGRGLRRSSSRYALSATARTALGRGLRRSSSRCALSATARTALSRGPRRSSSRCALSATARTALSRGPRRSCRSGPAVACPNSRRSRPSSPNRIRRLPSRPHDGRYRSA